MRLDDEGVTLAHALRDLFGALPQTEIAARLTEGGHPVDQTKVSRWLRGETEPSLDEIAIVENIFGKPKGWVLTRAGFTAVAGVEPLTELGVQPVTRSEFNQLRRQMNALTGRLGLMLDELDVDELPSLGTIPAAPDADQSPQ